MTAITTLPTTDTACSLCGLPAPYCPCDRRDIFTTPNTPLRVEHVTLTDDGRFITTPDADEPIGDPACYPSDAQMAAMHEEADDLRRREAEPFTNPEPDHYPALAERLAASMRDDR